MPTLHRACRYVSTAGLLLAAVLHAIGYFRIDPPFVASVALGVAALFLGPLAFAGLRPANAEWATSAARRWWAAAWALSFVTWLVFGLLRLGVTARYFADGLPQSVLSEVAQRQSRSAGILCLFLSFFGRFWFEKAIMLPGGKFAPGPGTRRRLTQAAVVLPLVAVAPALAWWSGSEGVRQAVTLVCGFGLILGMLVLGVVLLLSGLRRPGGEPEQAKDS